MSYVLHGRVVSLLRSWARHRNVLLVRAITLTTLQSTGGDVWQWTPEENVNVRAKRGVMCVLKNNDVLPSISPSILYSVEITTDAEAAARYVSKPVGKLQPACFLVRRLLRRPVFYPVTYQRHRPTHSPPAMDARTILSIIRHRSTSDLVDFPKPPHLSSPTETYTSFDQIVRFVGHGDTDIPASLGTQWQPLAEHFLPPQVLSLGRWLRPSQIDRLSLSELQDLTDLLRANPSITNILLLLVVARPDLHFTEAARHLPQELDGENTAITLQKSADYFLDRVRLCRMSPSTVFRVDIASLEQNRAFFNYLLARKAIVPVPNKPYSYTIARDSTAEDTVREWVAAAQPLLLHWPDVGDTVEENAYLFDVVDGLINERFPERPTVYLCPNPSSTNRWSWLDAINLNDFDGSSAVADLTIAVFDAHMLDLHTVAALVKRHPNVIALIGNMWTPASVRGAVFRDVWWSFFNLRREVCPQRNLVGLLRNDLVRPHPRNCPPLQVRFPSVNELPPRSSRTLWLAATNSRVRSEEWLCCYLQLAPEARSAFDLSSRCHRHIYCAGEISEITRAYFADDIDVDLSTMVNICHERGQPRFVRLDEPGLWLQLNQGAVDHRGCCGGKHARLMCPDQHINDCALATIVTSVVAARLQAKTFDEVVIIGFREDDWEACWDDVHHACRLATKSVATYQVTSIVMEQRRWQPFTAFGEMMRGLVTEQGSIR